MPRINIETPVHFKCQEDCSNCCTSAGGTVIISDKDIQRISKYLKISIQEFIKKYTHEEGTSICLVDKNNTDCIFLADHKCTIYPVRPIQCKTFPFWPQNLKSEKRWNIIMDECPGIGEGPAFSRQDIEDVFDGKSVDSTK